jgi:ribonucleoside-diphosphate reductase alpha chain/ribonucleoside-triphosphate reductase
MSDWSNLARVVFARTYSRSDSGRPETWEQTIERIIRGNIDGHNVSEKEINQLWSLLMFRKAGPAGRGYWYSGAPSHKVLGGVALNNCWFVTGDEWQNYVIAQDLLMLGGGVGMSVEHRFTSKLPVVQKGVWITHKATKDADYIIPDSREGWCKLTKKILKSFFETGESFTYSTVCIRGAGEPIKGFGGVASGPIPLIAFAEKLCNLLRSREGRQIRPIDSMDILCAIGEMVVAGNVRRSAIIILGDAFDKEYLKAKRFDLGPVPTQRAMANLSVVCDDTDDLHPLFWKTYEVGEPFGIVNRTNIRKFGRMGELKKDTAMGVNPCAEATLEDGEPCNLQELALPNLDDEAEFIMAARLMHRWGKRVTMEKYHHEKVDEVVKRNRRIGTGITGCLQSPLFTAKSLDAAYAAIQEENVKYSKELKIPESIRTTVVKPSGTISKVFDMRGYEGIHAAYSQHYIQRIRFASNDPLLPLLRTAGHHIEPVIRFDGSFDHNTVVVDFYEQAPAGAPVADQGWDTWKQLDAMKLAQKHWADQSVSVTVYYKKDEIGKLKAWLTENLKHLKTISFLCHDDHGFRQAPKEAISEEKYVSLNAKIKPIEGNLSGGGTIDGTECAGGMCPIK